MANAVGFFKKKIWNGRFRIEKTYRVFISEL